MELITLINTCVCDSTTHLDTIFRQLMRVSGTNNAITFDARVCDLGRYIAVRQTNNQTVFRCIVLVFILENQAFPSIVIGLSLTAPLEFNLITLKVLLVLHNFNETLREKETNSPKKKLKTELKDLGEKIIQVWTIEWKQQNHNFEVTLYRTDTWSKNRKI